ncbi:hypothetical protein GSS88_06595 [Corynebacterium sp. 3HC-13]|nr:hypothetical protein [Corynebacterium poyangense]MBZ8177464.1 hypothetical protein [Corynebacterium poyangense]
MVKPIQVPLSKLDLDLKNARFRSDAQTQESAVVLMLNSTGEKCMELLKDLCQQGNLSSSDVPIVVKEDNRYRVLEGNRRLICLKLWKNPSLLQKISPELAEKYQRRIEKLADSSRYAPPETMQVVVAGSLDEANVWIDKKHGLGKDGSATVEWGAFEKDRRSARQTGKTGRALSFIEFLTAEFADDDDISRTLGNLLNKQYSILNRVLANEVLRDEIGITYDNLSGVTSSKRSSKTMRPLLLAMLFDFAEKRQTAKTLHTADQISKYFHDLYLKYLDADAEEEKPGGGRPGGDSSGDLQFGHDKSSRNTSEVGRTEDGALNAKPNQNADENNEGRAKQKNQKSANNIFADLNTLNTDGFTPKIQRLIRQTADLSVYRQPELIAVSLRVILDLTCAQYLQEFHPCVEQVKRDLDQRIIEVLKLLDPKCTQGAKQAENTSEWAKLFTFTKDTKDALRLVQYALHDIKHVNTASDTMIMAERYQEMLVAMNEKLRKNKS